MSSFSHNYVPQCLKDSTNFVGEETTFPIFLILRKETEKIKRPTKQKKRGGVGEADRERVRERNQIVVFVVFL